MTARLQRELGDLTARLRNLEMRTEGFISSVGGRVDLLVVNDRLQYVGITVFPSDAEAGDTCYRSDEQGWYGYDGADWQLLGGATGGTPAAHASTHLPSGTDPIVTGTPVEISDSANDEGDSEGFARSNHLHAHGQRGGGDLHDVATSLLAGFMSASDKANLDLLVGHTHDHGVLTGLEDDDHGAIYPGLSQSEIITGLWTFDRDPNAPFAVTTGSAVVANLDADLLDGNHASAFATASHAHAHDELTGLGDDDHTIYLLANGSRGLSGDWDAGDYYIRVKQLIADTAVEGEEGGQLYIPSNDGGFRIGVQDGTGRVSMRWAAYESGSADYYAATGEIPLLFTMTSGYFSFRAAAAGTKDDSLTWTELVRIDDGTDTLQVAGNITVTGTVDGVNISDHSGDHESGGSDEIDGDHLDVDWNPSNYTPSTTPSEASSVDHLAAHLYGIDQALSSNNLRQHHVTLVAGEQSKGGSSYSDAGGDFYYDTSKYPSTSPTWRATLRTDSGQTAYIELYDMTNSTQVAELSTTSASYDHKSSSVSLTNGHYYRVRVKNSGGASYTHVLGSYLEW